MLLLQIQVVKSRKQQGRPLVVRGKIGCDSQWWSEHGAVPIEALARKLFTRTRLHYCASLIGTSHRKCLSFFYFFAIVDLYVDCGVFRSGCFNITCSSWVLFPYPYGLCRWTLFFWLGPYWLGFPLS